MKKSKKRDLSLEKIIAAALLEMEQRGADELTMRMIAERCDATAMAIYHHVGDKQELVNLAVDRIFAAAVNEAPSEGDWKSHLIHLFCDLRQRLVQVRGAGEIFVRQPILGPGTAAVTERMFSELKRGGYESTRIVELADALTVLLIGSIANELSRPADVRKKLGQFLPQDDTPHLQDHLTAYAERDGQQRFERALTHLFD